MILIKVDLPEPFSPSSPCTSPGRRVRLALSSARTPPKLFDTCRTASAATSAAHAPQLPVAVDVGAPVARVVAGRPAGIADVVRGEDPQRRMLAPHRPRAREHAKRLVHRRPADP